jgi:hypothetical protein
MKLRSVFLMALCCALTYSTLPLTAQESDDATSVGGKFDFRLRNGKEFTGYMMEKATVNLVVAGIELNVPIPLVESMKFDDKDIGRVRMQLSNGDSLSGQFVPGQLGVMADWGTLKINNGSLDSVTRAKMPAPVARSAAAARTRRAPAKPVSTN